MKVRLGDNPEDGRLLLGGVGQAESAAAPHSVDIGGATVVSPKRVSTTRATTVSVAPSQMPAPGLKRIPNYLIRRRLL